MGNNNVDEVQTLSKEDKVANQTVPYKLNVTTPLSMQMVNTTSFSTHMHTAEDIVLQIQM